MTLSPGALANPRLFAPRQICVGEFYGFIQRGLKTQNQLNMLLPFYVGYILGSGHFFVYSRRVRLTTVQLDNHVPTECRSIDCHWKASYKSVLLNNVLKLVNFHHLSTSD